MPLFSWNWWKEPADLASQQMLQLQIDNLAMRFRTIGNPPATASESLQKVYGRLVTLFEGADPPNGSRRDLTWDDAYRIESEIASLLSGSRLKQEIVSRLRWAVLDGVPGANDLQARYVELIKTVPDPPKPSADSLDPWDDVLRDFQLDVLEAIHWHSRHKHIARKLRSQATRRTLSFGLAALLVVLISWFVASANVAVPTKAAQLASLAPDNVLSAGFFTQDSGEKQFALYTALMFGFMGAIFSRLLTLQRQWDVMTLDELFNARTRSYIFLRATTGTLGALVIYFFLQSGLVKGSVFPNFEELGLNLKPLKDGWPSQVLLPSGGLSLLIMWSFIAGFSETLVSSVLDTTQRQFGGAVGNQR
ncbi:membrane hypothetical protein [Bradyrhizobium sp. STM 3843]|uniref:hypothetical protein n=1 Tax=Bradyrhizobium sp. STM 3843 TaxID=551947 RepID=UPI000240AEEA|nr:hypothetical protein [Bradyrhizobium sp. STM 3843]CCE05653.1 membrane hypothetical protein [Bradyrhizobium sp. STM 3843]